MTRRHASLERIYTLFAVIYVVVSQAMWRSADLANVALRPVYRALKLDAVVNRWPLATLTSTSALLVVAVANWPPIYSLPFYYMVLIALIWLLVLHLCTEAYLSAAATPTDPAKFKKVIESRWPDRWYAKHLSNPLNAIYVRTLIANSIFRLSAIAGLFLTGGESIPAILFLLVSELRSGMPHEVLDHADIHNNLFFNRKFKKRWIEYILWLTKLYLRGFLNLAYLRIPHFYRVQHVYIHHVENNSIDDTQSTIVRDRTSFLDFCDHSLKYALSWSFGLDVVAYLARRSNKQQLRLVVIGFLVWYALIVLIALYAPFVAIVLLLVRFAGGAGSATESYFQHGLADPDALDDIYRSTVSWIISSPSYYASGDFIHVRHHLKGGEHFSRQLTLTADDSDVFKGRGALCLGNGVDSAQLLRALLAKDFKAIAEFVVEPSKSMMSAEETERLLESRTRPTAYKQHLPALRRVEPALAKLYIYCFLPSPPRFDQ